MRAGSGGAYHQAGLDQMLQSAAHGDPGNAQSGRELELVVQLGARRQIPAVDYPFQEEGGCWPATGAPCATRS